MLRAFYIFLAMPIIAKLLASVPPEVKHNILRLAID
jgi:hypothetical protein